MSLDRKEIESCIETIRNGELLSEAQVSFVCEKLVEILLTEPNIKHVPTPVTIVGDIHGQYYDLLEAFHVGGEIPYTNYLFLGDYVDRGLYSVETMSLLTCLKVRYPERVTLIRGNHESRQTTMAYGFYAECTQKYKSAKVWKSFTDMFDYLPLAAIIDQRILALHAGLSPTFHSLDQLRVADRFHEVPFKGLLSDILWADPDSTHSGFKISSRGVGYTFGGDVVDKFLHINQIDLIVRSHQLCSQGYQVLFDEKVITVWSAPNYCYRMKNLACVLEINTDLSRYFNVFTENPEDHEGEHTGVMPADQSAFFD